MIFLSDVQKYLSWIQYNRNTIRFNGIIIFLLIIIQIRLGTLLIGRPHSIQNMFFHITIAIVLIGFSALNLLICYIRLNKSNNVVSLIIFLSTIGATISGVIFVIYNNDLALSLMGTFFTMTIFIFSIILIIFGKDSKIRIKNLQHFNNAILTQNF